MKLHPLFSWSRAFDPSAAGQVQSLTVASSATVVNSPCRRTLVDLVSCGEERLGMLRRAASLPWLRISVGEDRFLNAFLSELERRDLVAG